jgi:hypothetical protein
MQQSANPYCKELHLLQYLEESTGFAGALARVYAQKQMIIMWISEP